jgi:hypothetical protein
VIPQIDHISSLSRLAVAGEPDPLPAYLADHLRRICHFTDDQIAATSRDDAQRMLDDYYSRDLAEPDGG